MLTKHFRIVEHLYMSVSLRRATGRFADLVHTMPDQPVL